MSTGKATAPILGDRFIEDEDTGCWIWYGASQTRSGNGYGRVYESRQRGRPRKRFYTHRLAYEEFIGPIPRGLTIDHLCRTPACCNPGHLEAVTRQENVRRGKNAKLSHSLACFIRSSPLTNRELADLFRVHDSQISRIRTGKTWTWDSRF